MGGRDRSPGSACHASSSYWLQCSIALENSVLLLPLSWYGLGRCSKGNSQTRKLSMSQHLPNNLTMWGQLCSDIPGLLEEVITKNSHTLNSEVKQLSPQVSWDSHASPWDLLTLTAAFSSLVFGKCSVLQCPILQQKTKVLKSLSKCRALPVIVRTISDMWEDKGNSKVTLVPGWLRSYQKPLPYSYPQNHNHLSKTSSPNPSHWRLRIPVNLGSIETFLF